MTPIQVELTKLKFELLTRGMMVSRAARAELEYSQAKHPIRTRSGVSGGLDIVLPHDVHVNVPILESFTSESPLLFDFQNNDFLIVRNDRVLASAQVQPTPAYYLKSTSDGQEEMVRIGQMCSGDRFCYGMTGPGCFFWGKHKRCKYCSIGDNYRDDARRKRERHLVEVLENAISDSQLPANHVLIGGGTPPGEDMGAILAAELCRTIKERFDLSVYVMIVAPLKNKYIDMLHDAGVDELGMNLEFWSDEAWAKYIPGKNNVVGKQRYLEALEYAVQRFGAVNTRTILIAGIEDSRFTIEGARTVAARGIMPIISPFRPLNGTLMESYSGFDSDEYYEMFCEIREFTMDIDIPIGPTCIACQNNVLAVPFGKYYRYY